MINNRISSKLHTSSNSSELLLSTQLDNSTIDKEADFSNRYYRVSRKEYLIKRSECCLAKERAKDLWIVRGWNDGLPPENSNARGR